MVDERRVRRGLYLSFSRIFEYPESKDLYVERVKEALSGDAREDGIAKSLKEVLEGIKGVEEELLQEEATRLFVNSYPSTPCPPFESVYREGLLMGRSAEEVVLIYSMWGLETSDLPDHIGAELEFMAFLLGLPRWEEVKNQEVFFFREHIVSWVPQFCISWEESARLEFFRKVSLLLREFLKREMEIYRS